MASYTPAAKRFWIDAGTAVFANAVLTSSTGVREVFTYRITSMGGILIEVVEPAKPSGASPQP